MTMGRQISAEAVETTENILKYYAHQFGLDKPEAASDSYFVNTSRDQMPSRLYHNDPNGLPRCQIIIGADGTIE